MDRYRRLGHVRARRLTASKEWKSAHADVLTGAEGDWLVGSGKNERTVVDAEFRATHEHVFGDVYRRVGVVTAKRVTSDDRIPTHEGTSTARPGDWLLTSDGGSTWPVTDEYFQEHYAPLDPLREQPLRTVNPTLRSPARVRPQRASRLPQAYVPFLVALIVALAFLIWETYAVASLRDSEGKAAAASDALALTDTRIAISTVVLIVLTAGLYWWPRRSTSRSTFVMVASAGVTITLMLAGAAYLPCAESLSGGLAFLGWVLQIFAGNHESDGLGAVCLTLPPPGFQIARSLAMLLTLSSAAAVVLAFAGQRLARLRISRNRDADVLVGLGHGTLPLLEAIIAESRSRASFVDRWDRRPGWRARRSAKPTVPASENAPAALPWERAVTGWRWWYLTGLRPGDYARIRAKRPLVVVIEKDPANPLIPEASRLGAVILTGDATDCDVLRRVLVHRHWWRTPQIALRRMYAVTGDQQRNLDIWRSTLEVLSSGQLGPHILGAIPRVFVGMSDEREARMWRTNQLQHLGQDTAGCAPVISDAITIDGVTAAEVVSRILPREHVLPEHSTIAEILLVGESELATALLDELAWQLWCRFEVVGVTPGPESADRPRLETVTLAGRSAQRRAAEWHRLRAPWNRSDVASERTSLRLFDVTAYQGVDLEAHAEEVVDAGNLVLIVDDDPDSAAMALRLARRAVDSGAPHPLVYLNCASGSTGAEPAVPGGLRRFIRGWVRGTSSDPVAPRDSVTELARQHHQTYSKNWPEEFTPWNYDTSQDAWHAQRLAGRPWEDLDEFMQEDNVRQHWLVLTWLTSHGYEWRTVSAHQLERASERPEATPDRLSQDDWRVHARDIAAAEYARWAQLRMDFGWWPCEQHQRCDPQRMHHELRSWAMADQAYTEEQITGMIERLWVIGLQPVKAENPGAVSLSTR
jgi:hypothetical protein